MFRTFNFEEGKAIPSPVFYIDNMTENIVAQETWECSYLHKYEFPGYDSKMMVENLYENGDCEWFECITKRFWDVREAVVHLMLGMNENFDGDLIQEALELLDL
jgi:hypothetical protein